MTREEILRLCADGRITTEVAGQLIDVVESLSCKVGPKGGISVYGLQQRPVTLYVEQWERLFLCVDKIKAFIKEWEGKDYHSEAAPEQGGPKVQYTARILRKGATPLPCVALTAGLQSAALSPVPADECARQPFVRIGGNGSFGWGRRAKSFLGWLLAPFFAVVRS